MKSCLGRCLFLCCMLLFPSVSLAQVSAPLPHFSMETSARQIHEAPVVYLGETLFVLYEKVGSFTPQQRAQAIQVRLEHIANNPFSNFNVMTTITTEHGTDMALDGLVLLTVTDGDARPLSRSRQDLAQEYTGRLRNVLSRGQQELRTEMLLKDAAPAFRIEPLDSLLGKPAPGGPPPTSPRP